jgi:septal ring-binding cell division protein DamX
MASAGCSALIVIALLTGCTNAQVRRTPVTDLGEAWFCEMNETRDDWDCVQDENLARNPQPARLPSDPVEPDPFAEEAPALPKVATPTEGLANPSAAINFDALAQATVRPDTITALLERSPEHFAVQLTATETEALANGFISNYELDSEELMTLELAQEDDFYYVVLLGVYDTFAAAEAAVKSLPESLADEQPWIRPLASIQSGITDAEALRMGLND